MLNSITGTVTGKKGNTCFIENSGIEWALNCSQRSLDQIPKKGEEARVLTYLHHKEDTMLLFGFASEDERSLFLELIRISGIGPKQGIKILSGISAEAFINALEKDDIAGISSLPGIGKKTAQKIILSLRESWLKKIQNSTFLTLKLLIHCLIWVLTAKKRLRLSRSFLKILIYSNCPKQTERRRFSDVQLLLSAPDREI